MECTRNRVRQRYRDQLERSGHLWRPADLERFASLGIRAIRYPLLWERIAPAGPDSADWSWADDRLGRLRELGIRPIVGLVHHGSGPRGTSLLEGSFAVGLARFARAAAARYPWIEDWTPVNEPLTTARFSALYGHWYPHARDDRSFARAFVNQCRAIAGAMRAIREITPAARLVQTEDVGRTYSTAALRYQAAFENERRWATFDALAGRLGPSSAFGSFLESAGVPADELAELAAEPCPPDLIGLNHYVTSERFIDERLHRYPARAHGGNGRDRYADVEAVRVRAEGIGGPALVLAEAWARYGRPLAVTEAHLGCGREDQLRWLAEIWTAAREARHAGIDVRAVTVWAALGSFDWDRLATGPGAYEPGPYDVRGPEPRETALAQLARELARGAAPTHPVLASPGWWRRDSRLLYAAVSTAPLDGAITATPAATAAAPPARTACAPILVVGATGTLGRAFARVCEARGLAVRLVRRAECDISDAGTARRVVNDVRPWAVVNAAGYVRVDDAETDSARCFRDNHLAAVALARACSGARLPLATFSSDLVFDGRLSRPYVESDAVRPLSVYGRSKAAAEEGVLAVHPRALVVRTSAFFGPWDEHNFVTRTLRELQAGRAVAAADDVVVSPTHVPDLVGAVIDLLVDGESGLWHLANRGAVTWYGLARRAAALAGADESLVEPRRAATMGWAAERPRASALGSQRGALLPALDDALASYLQLCASDAVGGAVPAAT
jgi:dTDP-4-dehydrorhamnose reductase